MPFIIVSKCLLFPFSLFNLSQNSLKNIEICQRLLKIAFMFFHSRKIVLCCVVLKCQKKSFSSQKLERAIEAKGLCYIIAKQQILIMPFEINLQHKKNQQAFSIISQAYTEFSLILHHKIVQKLVKQKIISMLIIAFATFIYHKNKMKSLVQWQSGKEKISFKEGTNIQELLKKSTTNQLLKQLNSTLISLQRNWDHESAKEVLGCISEIQAYEFYSYFCGIQQIQGFIRDIRFPKLEVLDLESSIIQSLEIFPTISIPQLKHFRISTNALTEARNQVISLKPLRKAYLPHLKQIAVQGNEFRQLTGLPEANFPELEFLNIEGGYCQAAHYPESVNWLCKLSSPKMEKIWMYGRTRINQAEIRKKLQDRYPIISIWSYSQ